MTLNDPLIIAILAGLGGMLGWGSADFFAKKTIDKVGPIKSLVWGHGFGTAFFFMLALGQVFILEKSLESPTSLEWLGLFGFGLLQMVVYWLLYIGFEKGQLAVLNPVFASFTGVVALIAIVFFHQPISAVLSIAFGLIFIGILLINTDLESFRSKKLKIAPGLPEVSAATVLAAIWTLGWDKFVSGHDSLSYSLLMYTFMTIAAIGLAYLMKVKISGIRANADKSLALIGAGEALAYLSISWGYSSTNLTGIVALISGAFSIPTIVMAYLFLKERLTSLQVTAVIMIILGIVGTLLS